MMNEDRVADTVVDARRLVKAGEVMSEERRRWISPLASYVPKANMPELTT